MTAIVDGTSGITYPTWATGARPVSPSTGQMGFNTTLNTMETYSGTAWVPAGMSGGGTFAQNLTTLSANYTMPSNTSSSSTGPITLSSNVVVTLSSGTRWVIL
jgi:hypothetical protein